jgi:Domain of unknown function (DUF4159)
MRRIFSNIWPFVGLSVLLHAILIFYPLLTFSGCVHERPMGVLNGSGDKIAKGVPTGEMNGTGTGERQQVVRAKMAVQNVNERDRHRHEQEQLHRLYSQAGMVQLLHQQENGQVSVAQDQRADSALESSTDNNNDGDGTPAALGLAQGTGTGNTAAGSPFGTRIGGKLWLYRIRYDSESWDANWNGLPVLLKEVQQALGVNVASQQEVIRLSDLPKHRGPFMPTMLFITGTGRIETNDQDRANLRSYLLGGGMLVADNSGGDFEAAFEQFISQVLPGTNLREIERDHDIYRGAQMPYKMPDGCPVYRDHGAKHFGRGIFDKDGRLMVFFSPGDMGSAWEIVQLGKKRDTVEQAFHMGTNLVAYSLITVRDKRKVGTGGNAER